MDTSRKYLKTPDAADYLSRSPSFLAKARLAGNGPAYVKMGRCVAYTIESLDEYAARNMRRSTSESPLLSAPQISPKNRHQPRDAARGQ